MARRDGCFVCEEEFVELVGEAATVRPEGGDAEDVEVCERCSVRIILAGYYPFEKDGTKYVATEVE